MLYFEVKKTMGWKEFIADYFVFTKKERLGIIVIVLFIIGVFFLPKALHKSAKANDVVSDTSWIAALKKLEINDSANTYRQPELYSNEENSSYYQYDRVKNKYYGEQQGELFNFDPNTISADDWKKLGIREKTIATIKNYLNKGGKFRKPEDLQKIYGLFPNEYERIAPYIKIEPVAEGNNYTTYPEKRPTGNKPVKIYGSRYTIVDINKADTTALIALPGIGTKLAARIINFRDKLGGFYSIGQVGETFGLPDSTFQKIKQFLKLETGILKKININNATIDELKAHPYIKYSLANPIVAYRKEHGGFTALQDLKKVMIITEETFNKIAPYLTIE